MCAASATRIGWWELFLGDSNSLERHTGLRGNLPGVTRDQVYELIDGERDYQDSLGPERTDGKPKDVGSFLTLLSVYVDRAQRGYADTRGNSWALDEIRKVAGIAVACMEAHGAPGRFLDPATGIRVAKRPG